MSNDPVMLITGASSGIGEATARAAQKAGYRLVLSARSEDKLKHLQSELGGSERVMIAR
ncbi:SDR family NAD(P)-dependent oxidoreductase, partial [Marinobacter sp.]